MSNIKLICFWLCVACLFAGVLSGILAIWGAIGGDAVWKTLATFGLLFAGAMGLDGTVTYFYGPKKEIKS